MNDKKDDTTDENKSDRPTFENGKYWNDFVNAIKTQTSMDIVEYIYNKLVEESEPFDVNELWFRFMSTYDYAYIKGSAKYILKFGGNVNYIFDKKYLLTPVFAAIRSKDKPMIELMLTEYDCDLSHRTKPGDTLESQAKKYELEEFFNYCLEKRRLIVAKSDLEKKIEDQDLLKRTNAELEDTIQSMNKVFTKLNIDWVNHI